MPETAEQVDHRTRAEEFLRSAERRDRGHYGDLCRANQELRLAEVHASLAIAEGQERVAEAVEERADTWFRRALDEIRGLAGDEGETDDNKVRERIFHIAHDALERSR